MADEQYWYCRGEGNTHLEEEVEIGKPCPECGKTNVPTRGTAGRTGTLPIGKVLGGIALFAVLAGLGWYFLRPKPDVVVDPNPVPPVKPEPPKPTPTPTPTPTPSPNDDYSWQPERFTKGQRSLFSGVSSPSIENGIEAFKQQDYQKAITHFNQAVVRNPNEPEPLILFNNAKARQQGDALTLAVVVPVEGDVGSAKEMLRGVAMAQKEFNNSGGIGDSYLEIVIANDENKPEISEQVARQLSTDTSILGVIGHNSSDASEAGLKIYEADRLAMISPTATSTSLQSDIFFRTSPSDAASAQKLAQYVTEELSLSKVVIFYNPNSNYSNSLKENFESRYTGDIIDSIDLSEPGFSAKAEITVSVFQNEAEAALLFPNKNFTEAAREIAMENQAIASDQKLKLLGGDALYTAETLRQGGTNMEGLIIAVPWSRQSQTSQTFTQAGNEQWKAAVNWRTAMSYDATKAFISAFSNSNNTRSSVLENLRQIKLTPNETSGIDLQFTAQGERQSEAVLVEVSRDATEKPQGSEFGFKLLE